MRQLFRRPQADAATRGETERLAIIYQRKLAALDDLKKSLLHQAFSGQLIGGTKTRKTNTILQKA
jgi:hypothetical protein